MAMEKYKPELGQMCFGQPWKEYECPEYIKTVLDTIDNYMDTNRICENSDFRNTPFSNSGHRFKNDVFEANAYDWSECGCNWSDNKECTCGWEPQPYNFKWRDIEITWYKHSHRGVTINRKVTQKEAAEMLNDCLESLMKRT